MAYRSTHLIANGIVVDGTLPFEIGGGVTLRRPNKTELDKIRDVLKISSNSHGHWAPYEAVITEIHENGVSFFQTENPSEWHYYVLSDDVGGSAVHDLSEVLILMEPSIELSVRLISNSESGNESYGYAPPAPHIDERYYRDLHVSQRTVLSLQEFRRAEEIRLKLMSLHEDYEFIGHALRTMGELRRVSKSSRLQVIGLFSIIENLVTHSPRLKESLDSISHQLRGKLRLLTNMTENRELLARHFNETSDTNVWKKLYEYRSRIAHGSKADFDGELQVLKSNDNIVQFLYSFTKAIWIHALENPRFIADLKEC